MMMLVVVMTMPSGYDCREGFAGKDGGNHADHDGDGGDGDDDGDGGDGDGEDGDDDDWVIVIQLDSIYSQHLFII